MKKIFAALTLVLMFSATSAMAFTMDWVGSVRSGPGEEWVDNVYEFDWSSAGSGAVVPTGDNPFSFTNPEVGQTLDFLYQAQLVALTGPAGEVIGWPGLNTTFEVTFVAVLPEMITSVSPVPGDFSIELTTLGGGVWYMYIDHVRNAHVPSGMGFDDGHLIASGTWLPGYVTEFTATDIGEGIGSFQIGGLVNFADDDFIDPVYFPDGSQLLYDIMIGGTANQPAGTSTTSAFFGSRAGEGNLDVYAIEDVIQLFKVDGHHTFSVIPEPSTVILLGLGLLGLAGYSRKKFKK
ncbi:flocculation-associated PEP-CTERM protein PepA [Geoalkalibacter halelectricus]|uniref:flocculation-associated PEP-CTERM protein PepA n=1 Tax=Geoalkalibacter halelectricus TaxID=2847045 RepID=UPI003D19F830